MPGCGFFLRGNLLARDARRVDLADFNIFATRFGQSIGTPSSALRGAGVLEGVNADDPDLLDDLLA